MNDEQQTTEVRNTEVQNGATNVQRQTVSHSEKADSRVVASRVVWYIAGFIIILLVLRVVLYLLGANQGSGFVDFLYAISGVFAAPFYGIFQQPAYGSSVLDSASLVAIVVYALIAWGVAKLFTLNRTTGDAEV
jgi:hypothetical protein